MRLTTAPGVQTNTQNLRATWPTCLLGDLEAEAKLVIKNGFSCGTHTTVGEGIPHLRPFNVTEDGRLSFTEVKRIPPQPAVDTYGLLAGDILYNNTNSEELVGKCTYWPGRDSLHVLSNHMTILRVGSCPELEARFLGFFLLWFWASGSARLICRRHVNQASIGLERIRHIEVPCPPVQEQQAIAYILSRLQAAVEVQDRIVATLTELKAATMAKLFREGLRGEPLKQTEVGELPESWEVVRVGDLFAVQLGKMLSPRSMKGISPRPYLRNKNVQWGRFDLREVFQMDFSHDELERFRLKAGDVLVCEGGEPGRTAVWEGQIPDCCYQKALHRLRPKDAKPVLPRYFLYWATAAFTILRTYKPAGTKTTIAHLPKEKLEVMKMAVPVVPEQERIVEILGNLDGRLLKAETRAAILKSIFSSMLHLLMTGQVRVPPRMIGRLAARFRAQRPRPAGKPVDAAVVQEIVRRIVETVAPEKIILFGSGARGEMGPDSDLDLLVVKSCENRRELAQAIYRSLRGVGVPKDVVVVTPEDIEEQKDIPGMIVRAALREGKVLYAA